VRPWCDLLDRKPTAWGSGESQSASCGHARATLLRGRVGAQLHSAGNTHGASAKAPGRNKFPATTLSRSSEKKPPAGGKSPGLPLLALRSCPPSRPLCSEQGPEIVSGMRSPRPGRIEVIRVAIPNRFCHKHSTFLTLVNFRFVQCPHRFSAGGTEIEKLNALWLLQSTYAREVFERFPPGFS
jgi:hypothetical protein